MRFSYFLHILFYFKVTRFVGLHSSVQYEYFFHPFMEEIPSTREISHFSAVLKSPTLITHTHSPFSISQTYSLIYQWEKNNWIKSPPIHFIFNICFKKWSFQARDMICCAPQPMHCEAIQFQVTNILIVNAFYWIEAQPIHHSPSPISEF